DDRSDFLPELIHCQAAPGVSIVPLVGAIPAIIHAVVAHIERSEKDQSLPVNRLLDLSRSGIDLLYKVGIVDPEQRGQLPGLETAPLASFRQDISDRRRTVPLPLLKCLANLTIIYKGAFSSTCQHLNLPFPSAFADYRPFPAKSSFPKRGYPLSPVP